TPDARKVNALATLNIRGERSVTCRGDFDRHPSAGPLPPGAPPVCEMFRRLPDALERAGELDATYGRNPDIEKMPMYGVVFSFKDPFDTKDMRTTAGGDARYDIDFPARDHVLVEQLRDKGAIILPHKSMLGFNGGAIGADIYCDRSGILCRTIADCARVLDALKDPVEGYYDPRDPYTTVPRSSVSSTPYASHAKMSGAPGALKGVRIGIVRESMVYVAGSKAEEPIVTAAAREIKSVLGDRLGATLVESSDPLWTRDPDDEAMTTDFRRALTRLVPIVMPDLSFRLR